MDEITRRRFIADRAGTTAGPLRFALRRHDGGSAAVEDTRPNHDPAVRVAACDPLAMPSTRRIVQLGTPVDHYYEIAVRQLAPAPSNTIRAWSPPAGMSSRLGRGRPCCGLTARSSAPAGPCGCHFRGEAHRPRHRAGAISPCSCSTARGWGRGGTMKEAACDSSLLHVRTDGAPAGPGCPAPPGPAPSGQPPGSHPASYSRGRYRIQGVPGSARTRVRNVGSQVSEPGPCKTPWSWRGWSLPAGRSACAVQAGPSRPRRRRATPHRPDVGHGRGREPRGAPQLRLSIRCPPAGPAQERCESR
jgi:hypothetical protein